ncbi:glycosyltransferase family 9 protein [Nisaea denitrificans]|uniref:glycosyltransferase family 9 protein n=1 Tax=Nisaea denitrificans TaxID=390877 RepID=UPI0003FED642|nr:glycosyltransferase family 9 protein [Nisaea denitrificans]
MSILFITSTRIGDAILSTGILAWLHEQYPEDGITIACGGPASKVFGEVPNLEALHIIKKQPNHGHWWKLWRAMAPRKWRVVVDLRRSAMPWLLLAGKRYSVPKDRTGRHRVELNASMFGLPSLAPKIWTAPEHRETAEKLLAGAKNPIALAVGANWAGKTWPADRFAALAERIRQMQAFGPETEIVLVGGADEREAGATLLENQSGGRVIDAFGLDILSTCEVLKKCRLMVANDSAMMHLAAASGIPTIGLFGPTKDQHYRPWGENGFVVRTPDSADTLMARLRSDPASVTHLMDGITVEDVAAQVEELEARGLLAAR